MAPYQRERTAKDIPDVELWQQDVWMRIIEADLQGIPDQPDYDALCNSNKPAVSRYGATTPELESWFDTYNEEKAYRDRVKPFNFLLSAQISEEYKLSNQNAIKPVAPYQSTAAKSVKLFFDRQTGTPVKPNKLKTYSHALVQYHLHSESKFLNGSFCDRGYAHRRHIKLKSIRHIGKEANKWEQQYFLGANPEEQLDYGCGPKEQKEFVTYVNQRRKEIGLSIRRLALEAGVSYQQLSVILKGKTKVRIQTKKKIFNAITNSYSKLSSLSL